VAAPQLGGATIEAEVDDLLPQDQVDAQVAILLGRTQRQLVAGDPAGQVALAQVRALVRQLRLGADQRDFAVPTRVAQPGRDGVTGRAGADDYCSRSNSRRRRSDMNR